MKIRPKPGVQLAGIPADGADVPAELATEWLTAGLVTRVNPPKPKTSRPAPATTPKEG